MIYYEKMKYIESATLCFLFFYARAFTGIPGCECTTFASKEKNLLEAAKTTGKIAAFSTHSNELILAGDIFIIATPPSRTLTPTVMFRSVVAQWDSIRNEIER